MLVSSAVRVATASFQRVVAADASTAAIAEPATITAAATAEAARVREST